MLDKMKVIMFIGVALGILRTFFPTLDLGEDFEQALEGLVNSLYVLIPIGIGWKVKESAEKVAKLTTK